MKKTRQKLGSITVDTGTIVICDPIMIEKYDNSESERTFQIDLEISGLAPENFMDLSDEENSRLEEKVRNLGKEDPEELERLRNERSEELASELNSFSQIGIAAQINRRELRGGVLFAGHARAVTCLTGFGDGDYEVYAEYSHDPDSGSRIKRIEIIFIDDGDE
jgi:hypothetical protein